MTNNQVTSRPSQEDSDVEEIPRPDLQAQQNQQVIAREDSDVEEIPRPDLQPKQHVWNPPPMLINTTPWRRCMYFFNFFSFYKKAFRGK